LVVMWRLGATAKPGCITKQEFVNGMTAQGISSLKDISKKMKNNAYDPGFLETKDFREFYKFVFQFSREGTNKTIEKDFIVALLPIVLDTNKAPHLNEFIDFLNTLTGNNTRITLDQWDSFLLFNTTVKIDLSNYDENGAWPILLDEYIVWRQKKIGK